MAGPARAAPADTDYVAELVARSRAEDLGRDRQWLSLGYWQPDALGGGSTSLVANPAFFLAPGGRTDPSAELDATLAAFSAPAAADLDQHPQCLKPARWRWLKQRLQIDPIRLPEQPCPRLQEWLAEVNPGRLTLIFPAAYLNNPSSMFGHTLIRIDPPPTYRSAPLTSRTIHFSADHRGEQGVMFAVKGLTGYYQGYFSVLAYHEKVTQYSDIENRDIWEYELDFEREEIELILLSMWEMDLQPIDYYFFSTNCSFVLLSLLQVGRPDLKFTDAFPVYAIPVDTVRTVIDGTGLLRDAVFRPSQHTRIGNRWRQLDERARRLVVSLANGKTTPDDAELSALGATERARIIELAQAYLQYRLDVADIDRSEMAPRSLALLRVRAGITDAPPAEPDPAPDVRPDQGHRSARLAAGFGMTGDRPFAELALRPAYHDLLDPIGGYVPGAAIDFLDVHVRWYGDPVPELETATLIGITSLIPRDALFSPLSWRARIGLDRFRDRAEAPGDLVFSAGGGAGPAWALGSDARAYAFADAAILADRHWPGGRVFGVGPAAGLLWTPEPWWTIQPEASWSWLVEGGIGTGFSASLEQGFALARDLSLRLSVAARNDGDETYPEWSAMLAWYF